ncbi:BEL1-like homeodomain protein 9 [Nicotiana tomentosiformis]|nr:BEL1-like homeodomain protein 9 isoform X2 [Nicotiana tomentosiformis]
MAEGFEAYHVPQQSRRDRLRVFVQNHPSDSAAGLLPFVDHHSLIPSDFLLVSDAKEKGVNFMDPQLSSGVSFQEINGNPFLYSHQNFRFLDQSFNGGDVDVVYKQEPLSSLAAVPATNISNNNITTGQGLSLSLSSSHHYNNQSSSSSNLPLELNLQRYDSSIFTNDMLSKSNATVPLGPFTGYASILKGSRFLKPAQRLLEEICDVGRGIYAEKLAANDNYAVMDPSLEAPLSDDPQYSCGDGSHELRRNKSKLISMLNEVYRRYKQYYQQLQAVVASFESVPGLGNAAPFAKLSLKALSKHFRCLKNAITDQLQYTGKSPNCESDNSIPRAGNPAGKDIYFQRQAIHNAGFVDHQPVWRPQRGLPERAVIVLRAWLFDHFLHPYPTDSDKVMLAKQTGLSRNQVSNWFINARVRLWKPMVEEIHNLETRQAQKAASQREGQNKNNPIEHFPTSNSLPSEHPSTSSQQFHDVPSKRTRNNDPSETHLGGDDQETMNLSYDNFSPHSHVGIDQMSASAGNGGVSLTLGLHQNNNVSIGLSGSFPRNAARRFGIDANNEGFMFGGFETQNRQLGRDNNIIGGQLLHDFVG